MYKTCSYRLRAEIVYHEILRQGSVLKTTLGDLMTLLLLVVL